MGGNTSSCIELLKDRALGSSSSNDKNMDLFALFSIVNSIFEHFEDAYIKDNNKSLMTPDEQLLAPQISNKHLSNSDSLDYFSNLRLTFQDHLQRISDWDVEGCQVYEGLSAARSREWSGTSRALKLLRFAAKLSNDVFSAQSADLSQTVHMNVFKGLINQHRKSDSKISCGSNNFKNNNDTSLENNTLMQDNSIIKPDIINSPPLISLSHLQAIWIASLVLTRLDKTKVNSENNRSDICLFASLDCVWLGYKLSEACAGEEKDIWIELTIDSNGEEFILNPIKSKFDDLSHLIEFQNNIFTNPICATESSTDVVRPPHLSPEYYTSILIPQLVILTCLIPLTRGLHPVSAPIWELCNALFTVHQSIRSETKDELNPHLSSSLPALLDAKFEHIFNSFRDHEKDFSILSSAAVERAIAHFRFSHTIQPMNYLNSYEFGRALYINSLEHLSESVTVFDKLTTQLKYLEELALEIDESASLPVLAQIISLKAARIAEIFDVEGSFAPQDRVEVLWSVQNDDGSVEESFYPGTIIFDMKNNGLILKYDEDDGKEYRVECIDDSSLMNLNDDVEMEWRYIQNDDLDVNSGKTATDVVDIVNNNNCNTSNNNNNNNNNKVDEKKCNGDNDNNFNLSETDVPPGNISNNNINNIDFSSSSGNSGEVKNDNSGDELFKRRRIE